MANKKKVVEKNYILKVNTKCNECGKIALKVAPCEKCGGVVFVREYKAVEIEKNESES